MLKIFKIFKDLQRQLNMGCFQNIQIGPICLNSTPVKNTLLGFAAAWKTQYANVLHEGAREKLVRAVAYQEEAMTQISDEVDSLDQLNDALSRLQEVYDMVNKIDSIYRPIEENYRMLRYLFARLMSL